MLGDFLYCSSSSEVSDSEGDSDGSHKVDDGIDKLITEKRILEEKIKEREQRLKFIQTQLKSLNEERKRLFVLRKKMAPSSTDSAQEITGSCTRGIEPDDQILSNGSVQPLDLDYKLQKNDDEEEFDSDDEP